MKILIGFLLLFPSQDSERSKAEARLAAMRISLSYQGTPLRAVVDYLRDFTDLNIVFDGDALGRAESPVTITLKGVAVRSALGLILDPLGLVLTWKEGVFLIATRAKAGRNVRLRIYDVRELMFRIRDFPGVDLQLASSGIGATVAVEEPPDPPEIPLEEIVRAHTGGKSWEENPEVRISLTNGLLVVRQTPEVHAQLRRLLALLRRNK